jgi:hypothetical protein
VSARWKKDPDILATDLDDEVVLLHPKTRGMYTLNETGRVIWQLLASETRIDDAVAVLTATFEVDDDTARAHAAKLFADLAAAGLIHKS